MFIGAQNARLPTSATTGDGWSIFETQLSPEAPHANAGLPPVPVKINHPATLATLEYKQK